MQNQQPHILIIGASSKTGRALISFFSQEKDAIYSISDIKLNYFSEFSDKILTKPKYIYDSPEQTTDQLKEITKIYIAPGVPRTSPLLQEAQKRNIPIDSEICLAIQVLEKTNKRPTILGITGSLGKSTTCFLLYQIIKNGYTKGKVFLLGNFGTPLIEYINEIKKNDIVILELSSYQLEDAEKYRLNGVSILNVSPNHLDRYPSYQDYQKAKEKIFASQLSSDFAVLNKSQPQFIEWKSLLKGKLFTTAKTSDPTSTFYLDSDRNICHKNTIFIGVNNILLNSPHNLENICIALTFANEIGINPTVMKNTVAQFKGLEHRSEWVRQIEKLTFINDSKATTPYAILPNLNNPQYKDILLILGGKNKNLDFSILKDSLQNVKYIIYYGYSGQQIQEQLPFSNSTYIYDFNEAILNAYSVGKEILVDTILLSPGCASFDQFTSYKHRGNVFKEIINILE